MRTSIKVASLLSCAILVSLAGCSRGDAPPLGGVHGNVKINGKPVEHLSVIFRPQKGKSGVGETDAQGNYTVVFGRVGQEGAPVGECTISFQWPTGYQPPEGVAIPEGWAGDSETKVEVKPGNNTFDFNLE
ncbi:MAG: hypothetical protein KDA68_07445 [Planctomycetaceae bacterium]|nr:hypothetical protein [Planctomycetaceae bacterium]